MTIPTITKVMPCPKCINGMMRLEPEEYGEQWVCINCGERRSLNQMEEKETEMQEETTKITSVKGSEMELTEALKQELEGMKPEYQDKLAHLINTMHSSGAWGGDFADLAVVAKNTGEILLRDTDA